jgi:2-methylcitrate dehydratase PrpD
VGPERIYEGRFGLYRSHLGPAWVGDVSAATDGLGERWEVLRIALKPYPVCHFTHAFADAAIELVHQGLRPEEIESVECLIAPGQVDTVCEPAESKKAPKTDYEAKFSLPFVVATCLIRGRLGLAELFEDTLFDPAIVDLAARVGYRTDPDSGFPRHYSGEVVVTTKDGRVLRVREQINRGAEERPLDDITVMEKFRSNVCLSRSAAFADQLTESLSSIDTCPDINLIAEMLRG